METPRFLILLALLSAGCERSSPPPAAAPAPGGGAPRATGETAAGAPLEAPKSAAGARGLKAPEWYLEARSAHAKAAAALAAGDSKTALEHLGLVLDLDPGNLAAITAKARLCRDLGRLEEALATLDAGLTAHPGDITLLHDKAQTLLANGDYEKGLETVDGALAGGGQAPHVRFLRAVLLAARKEGDKALVALRDAVDNGFLGLRQIEGEAHFEFLKGDPRFQGILEDVRRPLEEAAKIDPPPPEEPPVPLPEARQSADSRELRDELALNLKSASGKPLAIDLPGLDGKAVRLADFAGKAVIVQLWGIWSERSRKQLPQLLALRDSMRERGLAVLTLAFELDADPEPTRESLRAFLRGQKIDLPCAIISSRMAHELGVSSYPTTIFVAKDGKSYLTAPGLLDLPGLRLLAETLLEGPSPNPIPLPPRDPRASPPLTGGDAKKS